MNFNYTDILIDINTLNKYYYILISLEQSEDKQKIKYNDLLDKLKIFNLTSKFIHFEYEPKWVYCNFLIQNEYNDAEYDDVLYYSSNSEFECDDFLDKAFYEINTFQSSELSVYYGYIYHNNTINSIKEAYKLNTITINNDMTLIEHSLYDKSSIYFTNKRNTYSPETINILGSVLYNYDCEYQIYDKKNNKRIVQTSDYNIFKKKSSNSNFFRKIKLFELFKKINILN